MPQPERDNDLVLSPNEYTYISDTTTGLINVKLYHTKDDVRVIVPVSVYDCCESIVVGMCVVGCASQIDILNNPTAPAALFKCMPIVVKFQLTLAELYPVLKVKQL